MAELLIRAGQTDTALIERALRGPRDRRPHRVVVDAHVAATEPRISAAAQAAGLPFLIDPQTHLLQDRQHSGDAWAQLPFADAAITTPADLIRAGAAETTAAAAVDYQLAHGATALIAPYVHIERSDDGWLQTQLRLWQATRAHLDASNLQLPVIAVVAVGWRLLDRPTWANTLLPLIRQLEQLHPAEIALAASKVDAGANPTDRLVAFVATLRRLAKTAPVLAWQQGALGEAAIAAGAAGYECGIGWRERCDLRAAMAAHREPRSGSGAPRPVYIDNLRRSLPKRTVLTLLTSLSVIGDIVCDVPACCPGGKRDLLGDTRAHAIAARRRSLDAASAPVQPAWQWKHLATVAERGLDLAEKINALAGRTTGITRVDDHALAAMFALAESRRQILRRHRAA